MLYFLEVFFGLIFLVVSLMPLNIAPPKVKVLVGRDNKCGNQLEAWVVSPNGHITKRITEAWIYEGSKRLDVLNSITDRRFQLHNKKYAIFCCGDVLIDKRRSPITNSKAAFVLAHYRAKGRNFTPSMRNLGMPAFLSHHVKHPYKTISFAYNGKNDLKPIDELKGEFQGLKWIARIYCV